MSALRTSVSLKLRVFISAARPSLAPPAAGDAGPPEEHAATRPAIRRCLYMASPPERADEIDHLRHHLGLLLELRLRRHRRALADRGAAHQDRLLDLLVGDAGLPGLVGVVARLGVERPRRGALRGRAGRRLSLRR